MINLHEGHTLKKIVLCFKTLLTAAVASLCAYYLSVPVPFLLGPLFVIAALSTFKINFFIPSQLVNIIFMTIGIYLGETFSVGLSVFTLEWVFTSISLLCLTVFTTFLGTFYLIKYTNCSKREGIYSSLPGALAYISLYIYKQNIPIQRIITIQSIRVLLVVTIIPFFYDRGLDRPFHFLINEELLVLFTIFINYVVLLGGAFLLTFIFNKIKVPHSSFIGGVVASAILYKTGVVNISLPKELILLAMMLIGAMIGERYKNITWRELLNYGWQGVVITSLSLLATVIFVWVLSLFVFNFSSLFLAFVPGGVHEMVLIALSFGIEPVFIGTHHLLRILFISLLLPLLRYIK